MKERTFFQASAVLFLILLTGCASHKEESIFLSQDLPEAFRAHKNGLSLPADETVPPNHNMLYSTIEEI